MSNKLKKTIKNKWLKVKGIQQTKQAIVPMQLNCIVTNDEIGKTLSIGNDEMMFTIAFEEIEKYLR